ncbi:hypothetical protein [Aquibacillus rhizosphaerae]|uniref:Uncharacterized protein n=1 Tax=Aquibacillus rhizosphaerae TaxID=3051431 RepID=A0ABT7L3U8_9BACI|nr:hypothetical protein [Aquibacillus sp. LR5S19]MDL4840542.1 hypothetical protein [Aquibacillus sp. LR5S19]
MSRMRMVYNFAKSVNLDNNRYTFYNQTDKLRRLNTDIVSYIKNELEHSDGDIVDSIKKEIIDHQQQSNIKIDHLEDDIDKMSRDYTDHVNDMRKQNITVYYDYEEPSSYSYSRIW